MASVIGIFLIIIALKFMVANNSALVNYVLDGAAQIEANVVAIVSQTDSAQLRPIA